MLTRAARVKLAVFALIAVTVISYTGLHYAKLGRYVGAGGYYVVKLDLASAGGIFPNADVTYRGVSVGRVGAIALTASGVQADLDISDSAPPIPARLRASVADLSAVGEEYVDLRPDVSSGAYLTGGSVIPERETALPLPVTTLLTSVNTLVSSVPLGSLRDLISSLAQGLGGQQGNLQALLDGQSKLAKAAAAATAPTIGLINNSRTVLATQVAESSALESFGTDAERLAAQLAQSDPSLSRLISNGAPAATQVIGLITDNSLSLGALIANLLTTSEVTVTRGSALDELLSGLPAAVAAGSTVIRATGARVGIALTFFNPLPCTAGYGGTVYRNGLVTSPGQPLNTAARCTLPASSGVDVRGSAHAPGGGPVPAPAQPGMASLLGLAP
jgi:phospholipid/cholesterol/gamma-HCH transport system substrate-binding protein